MKLVNLITGQLEKIDALRDLVKSGHNLLRTVDGLLKDIQTLGDIDIDSKLHATPMLCDVIVIVTCIMILTFTYSFFFLHYSCRH